ncbi:MAG: glycosyltransferase family 4 protein [Desulfurococcaceae archaeon]
MVKFNLIFITSVNIAYPGGVERWLKELSQLLKSRGHSVSIMQTNWMPHNSTITGSENIELQGKLIYNCKYFKISGIETVIIDPNKVIKILRELLSLSNVNLIYHLIYPPNENIVGYILKVIKMSTVAGIHFNFPSLTARAKWKLYFPIFLKGIKKYDVIHVLNQNIYNYFKKIGYSNVYFVPNGIDTSKFYIDESDIFKIYWSGRFTYDKGADIAINIVKAFNDRYSHEVERKKVLFVFSGSGDRKYEEFLKKLSKKYNNVKYLGLVPDSLLPQCYATSNLFLVTSRIEGMPMRVLEATASGLPVVGSNIPGVTDILRITRVGSLVEPSNIADFVEAIRKFFELWKENPSYYFYIKKVIRSRTVMNYDWQVVLPRIERMLTHAIRI